jgi:hypothetical protein
VKDAAVPAKPIWTSSSFLLYAGAVFTTIGAFQGLLYLDENFGWGELTGWAALELVVFVFLAIVARGSGNFVLGGLFAIQAAVAWGAFVGIAFVWFGWLGEDASLVTDFDPVLLLVELLALVGAAAALRAFRFPLLVALVAAAFFLFAVDLISNGGNGTAVVSLLLGILFLLAAVSTDRGGRRVFGFWLHVAGGLAIGGALIWFWHESDTDWWLIAGTGVVFVAVAALTRRSSWAVLGAYGMYVAASILAGRWSDARVEDIPPGLIVAPLALLPIPGLFGFGDGGLERPWTFPLTYGVLGFVFIALGLVLARRTHEPERRPLAAPA